MSMTTSSSTGKRYGIKRVCQIWQVPRSTLYEARRSKRETHSKGKRGPVPTICDQELLVQIRQVIRDSKFTGEGHRKIHARLRRLGLRASPKRILRLMKEHRLLSPHRSRQGKPKSHDGRITTDQPREMWGTDATKILTLEDGWVWCFGIIDHWNAECLGWHVTKNGDRFAALEALRGAIRTSYGNLEPEIARGVKLRPDHGSQFTSHEFRHEAKYWGLSFSYSIPREPETNGVIERFHRTLKEQVVHGRTYRNADELRQALAAFMTTYNQEWLLQKLKYQSPIEARLAWEMAHAA